MVLSYLLVFALFTLLFLGLFHTPLLNSQKVLFYRGSLLLGLTALTFLLISGVCKRVLRVRFETILAAIVMSASLHLAFFVTFPVTFDRSVTMYLLNRLNTSQSRQCPGLTPEAMQAVFIKEYVKEQQAIARRIREQSIINMLEEKNRCVVVTARAQKFLQFSELVKKLYGI